MVFDALPFTSRPPGAPRTPRDTEAGEINIKAGKPTRSSPCRVAEPRAAQSPVGWTALRVASLVERPKPRTTRKPARRVDPPRRPAETRAVRQPAGSTARPTRASHPSRRVPRGVPQTLGDA